MALIDKVRVIKLLLFALFMMVSMVTPAQSQVDWSIKAGIGMANIIGDNMGSPKVKLAYKLGIGLECPFDKIWSLQTGVSFVSKGTNHTIVELVIYEGRNHQVKKMFEAIGYKVLKLKREKFSFLSVSNLKSGEYRLLSVKEVKKLYSEVQK